MPLYINYITITSQYSYTPLPKNRVLEPQLATKKELQAFHSSAYLHFLDTHNNHNSAEDDDLLLFGAESEEMEVFGLGKQKEETDMLHNITQSQ